MPKHNIENELEQARMSAVLSMFRTPQGRTVGFGIVNGNGIEGWAPGAYFGNTSTGVSYVNSGTITTASWSQLDSTTWTRLDTETMLFGTGSDVELQWDASKFIMAPASGMWADCPMVNYANGMAAAFEFFDDFHTYDPTATVGGWLEAEAGGAAGTFVLGDAIPGGNLINTRAATDDDDGGQITQVAAPFRLAATKDLWFECRFRVDGDVTQSDIYIGLCSLAEDLTAVADNLAADGVIIHKDDGAATLKITASKGGTNTGANADIGTLSHATWTTVGFFVNGVTNITPYVDGVADTAITATLPDDQNLGVILGVRNGDATTTEVLTVDYVKCIQLR